jgi:DNA-binding CsgD family transcriptional regulator
VGVVSAQDYPGEQTTGRGPTEALVTLAQLAVDGADFHRLTQEAARATARAMGADRCEVLRLASDGERLLRLASSGEGTAQDEAGAVPGGVSSPAGYALLCEAPVLSEDLENERCFGAAGAPPWDGPVSAAAAPIPGRGSDFGVLVAYAARAGAFDGRHALSMARAASLLGGALQRLDEREELRRRAEEAERRFGTSVGAGESSLGLGDLGLTDRQLDVLRLMADGHSAKQIASELGLSIHTVHSHQRNLYRALGVGSFAGALKRGRELGLLEAPSTNPENL